jgi:hypothetical protein
MQRIRGLFITLLAALATVSISFAWGPHPEIVDAAWKVLPAKDQVLLFQALGRESRTLRYLVWMGDFGNQFETWNEGWGSRDQLNATVQFYANDYLVFPLAPRLYQHEVPDIVHSGAAQSDTHRGGS